MKRCAELGLLLILGVTGCFDKQAATSGQIGCAPSDVEISDEESGYSSQTWTATCGRERYYCSLVGTGKDTNQVNCHSASTPTATTPKPVQPSGTAAEPKQTATEQEPPSVVAGFTFGTTVAQASTACSEHGYDWQPGTQDHFRCSRTPVSIGIDALPTVRFCKEKLCAISLNVASPNAWLAAYAKFSQVLTKKYGSPANSKGDIRSNCATEAAFEGCIMTDGLTLVRDWKWDSGARISLRLAAAQNSPELTIIYIRQPQHEIVPDAL